MVTKWKQNNTKQLYKGYRRIVQGLYKNYHTSKPKKSKILNLGQSETSVRGLEHCSQVSSTYYFEYLLIWQRNLARPFNSFFLFSHLKILQEKVKRKNNKKHTVKSNHQRCRLAAKTPLWQVERHPSEQMPTKAGGGFFLRGGVWILSSTVQTRSIISLKDWVSSIFHHPEIVSVGEVLSLQKSPPQWWCLEFCLLSITQTTIL